MKYYDGEGSDRIELTPSAGGKDCLGNGEHEGIEIRCDECDFLMLCTKTVSIDTLPRPKDKNSGGDFYGIDKLKKM